MTPITRICPIYCVKNIIQTVKWYEAHLGFTTEFLSNSYAIISKDSSRIHLQSQSEPEILRITANNIELIIDVEDIESYSNEIMSTNPETQISPLALRPWGNQEMHIKDPNGALIRIIKTQNI